MLLETNDPNAWQSDFEEGLFIDYRHFDAQNITPFYEFGYRLSYTTFDISEISLTNAYSGGKYQAITPLPPSAAPAPAPGCNPALWTPLHNVTCRVSNTGTISGATVAQLYVTLPTGRTGDTPAGTPVRVLRGFEKVNVKPEKSVEVVFEIMRRDVSFWDVEAPDWRIPSGRVERAVSLSSRDIKGTVSVSIVQ